MALKIVRKEFLRPFCVILFSKLIRPERDRMNHGFACTKVLPVASRASAGDGIQIGFLVGGENESNPHEAILTSHLFLEERGKSEARIRVLIG